MYHVLGTVEHTAFVVDAKWNFKDALLFCQRKSLNLISFDELKRYLLVLVVLVEVVEVVPIVLKVILYLGKQYAYLSCSSYSLSSWLLWWLLLVEK